MEAPPAQMVAGDAVTVITGAGFTTNVTFAELLQPEELPVILYTVVTEGVTITLAPVKLPGFQVYDAPPVPLNVADWPLQMAVGEADALTTGSGTTAMATTLCDEQPNALAPVTV